MIGKRAFEYIAQDSSSVSSLVVRGRIPPCLRNDSVTWQNLVAKLETIRVITSARADDDNDDDGGDDGGDDDDDDDDDDELYDDDDDYLYDALLLVLQLLE
jgi:hypothetical protein